MRLGNGNRDRLEESDVAGRTFQFWPGTVCFFVLLAAFDDHSKQTLTHTKSSTTWVTCKTHMPFCLDSTSILP